ncbi:hypothetical protein [Actinoplanes rectilineatus]|uniref:hypothetical protein n=1 Tax=Actinoplanes rectilineatus TaxID=113571 RepID=UPI001FE1C6D7|nr:hypothetical protein [Actinoplanes rectilineatus]
MAAAVATPILYDPAVSHTRRVYRRRDGQVLILLGLWAVVMVGVLWLEWPGETMLAISIIGPVGLILFLFGPAVSVVVTPAEVVVNNTFHRWRIARSIATFPDPESPNDSFIAVQGHPAVDMAALQSFFHRRADRDALRWLAGALEQVGRLPDDGRRRLGVHWVNLAIAAAAIGLWIWSDSLIP